ncbi:MAG TPA: hypothetical protein VHP32_04215 [Ignavibacteria bacterium]|nr:hypothetical protein [Ignavibacteria bacterium]
MRSQLITKLLQSTNPSIRWKVRVNVLGENPNSKEIKNLREEIRNGDIAKKLLPRHDKSGHIISKGHVYDKWQGAHWVLASLADIGYPENDKSLHPAKDDVLDAWLNPFYFNEVIIEKKSQLQQKEGVPVIEGRYRRCGSMQGNALWYLQKLGFKDKRIDSLVERLLHWQWPDGGWNCDKNFSADTSSFMETILPLRGLALYAKLNNDKKVRKAADKAAEVFLSRHLYKRITNGKIIHPEFTHLHYHLYWHYDILHGLKVLAESGYIKDKRCNDALDLLESKELKSTGESQGWPAEKKYFKTSNTLGHNTDYVNWGSPSKKIMNEWVTADALFVLKEAGRL